MRNTATEPLHSYKLAIGDCKRLFDLDIDEYTLSEYLPYVMRQTGGYKTAVYSKFETIKDFRVDLSCLCNWLRIESVSTQTAFNNDTLIKSNQDLDTELRTGLINAYTPGTVIENGRAIEYENVFNQYGEYTGKQQVVNQTNASDGLIIEYNKGVIVKPKGQLINFTNEGDALTFAVDKLPIEIIYIAVLSDKEGFPMLTEKAITALAYYANFVNEQKRAFKMRDASMFVVATELKDKYMGQARTNFLTQNEWNEILDERTSMNRKMFGLPFRQNVG